MVYYLNHLAAMLFLPTHLITDAFPLWYFPSLNRISSSSNILRAAHLRVKPDKQHTIEFNAIVVHIS